MSMSANEPFWLVVIDCLVELHGLSSKKARSLVIDLKTRLEIEVPDPDLIYHVEPFELANDLGSEHSGTPLRPRNFEDEYAGIVRRHYDGVVARRS